MGFIFQMFDANHSVDVDDEGISEDDDVSDDDDDDMDDMYYEDDDPDAANEVIGSHVNEQAEGPSAAEAVPAQFAGKGSVTAVQRLMKGNCFLYLLSKISAVRIY